LGKVGVGGRDTLGKSEVSIVHKRSFINIKLTFMCQNYFPHFYHWVKDSLTYGKSAELEPVEGLPTPSSTKHYRITTQREFERTTYVIYAVPFQNFHTDEYKILHANNTHNHLLVRTEVHQVSKTEDFSQHPYLIKKTKGRALATKYKVTL